MAAGRSGRRIGLALGPIRVHTPLILAPMAGVTDGPFRRICREFGEAPLRQSHPELLGRAVRGVDGPAGLYVAEMVTARALLERDPNAWRMVEPDPAERVRSVQLYGTDAPTLAAATKVLLQRGLADHIDLNFGCPVPKVTRKGGGAAIPWKRDLFEDIVTSVVQSAEQNAEGGPGSVPVTVKMRIGIDDEHITVFDAADIARRVGVAGVGLHARTQEQYYSGAARWPWIARLKERMDIPVFGNGDVFTGEDALAMMDETGCDAVTIGRGAQGRPWLFADVVAAMWGLSKPSPPALGMVSAVLLDHARATVLTFGSEVRAMKEMRKHVGWYLKGFSVGGAARRELNLVSSVAELEGLLGQLDSEQILREGSAGKGVRAGTPRKPHLPHGWLDSQTLSDNERGTLAKADEDGGSGG